MLYIFVIIFDKNLFIKIIIVTAYYHLLISKNNNNTLLLYFQKRELLIRNIIRSIQPLLIFPFPFILKIKNGDHLIMKTPALVQFFYIMNFLDKIYMPLHIKLRAQQLKKKIPKDINNIIYSYENNEFKKQSIIIFSLWKDGFSTILNAKAIDPNYILVSPEWATRLILFDNADTHNAFLITLGHEMTHNEGDFPETHTHFNDKKFIKWVNEVHADFGAAHKMTSSSRQKLLDSIEYKLSLKKQDNDSTTHPSWERRKGYVENYDFDNKLIKKIALDTDCTNSTLINDICNHYKINEAPINLKY